MGAIPMPPLSNTAALAQGRSVYAVFLLDDDDGCPSQSARNRAGLDVELVDVLPSGNRLQRLRHAAR